MPVPAPEGTSLRPSGMGRSDVWPWLACLLFGLLMSTLPHWIRPRPGQGAGWIASKGELGCYLSVGAQAYHNHPWRLTDPVLADGGDSMYPALQLVPGIWIAKFFGLGPLGITLGWRIWAQVPGVRARSLARGLAIYRSVASHVPGALRRYGVRYVALPAATPTPRYLAEGWKRLQAGPHWQLWERVPSALTK